MEQEDSRLLYKTSCDECGSSDASARYSNGSMHCFSCNHHGVWDKSKTQKKQSKMSSSKDLFIYDNAEVVPLTARKISQATCEFFGVKVGKDSYGNTVQMFPYYENGHVVSIKLKDKDKNFVSVGGKSSALFGQNKWPADGKKLIITEGELDAMSMSQVQGNKFPVVSIPKGAAGAVKSIKENLEWIEGFDEVIIMFDMDVPGKEAAMEVAEIISPGKVKIASLPLKDANEMLLAGRTEDLMTAMWKAVPFKPDGILSGEDLWDLVKEEKVVESILYPWSDLNDKTKGIRQKELITIIAGSGVGKSNFIREIAYHLLKKNEKVGMFMLEEDAERSVYGMMGLAANRPLHISRRGVTQEDKRKYFDATVGSGNLYLYNNFGTSDIDGVLNKIRYLAKGCGVKYIFLDHISMLVSGMEQKAGISERQVLDKASTDLRKIVQETGITLFMVSHINRASEGKTFEEGGRPTLQNIRGTGGIGQVSDMVIALVRDQQGEKPNETDVFILKNRFSGETGDGVKLAYDHFSGRQTQVDKQVFVPVIDKATGVEAPF